MKAMIAAIDEIIRKEIDLEGPGVAVAVVHDGKPVHVAGYGIANLEWNCPIRPDTVFQLASVTKQFTATAIMLLEQEGKLRLDDPITTYFPDYPTHGHTITITHLLNHTSGIKSYTALENFFPDIAQKMMNAEELLPFFKDLPPDFEPGTRYAYNNSGYHLLGLLIEKVSGLSYEQFIQKRIFEPLQMQHSYYVHNESVIPNRASGYEKGEDGYQHATYLNMMIPYAAGSLGSTVEDLILWDTSLREERLLDKATQERMYTPTILTNGESESYGFGWGVSDYAGHRLVSHGGGIPGFHTFIARFIDDATMIVVLSNYPPTLVEKLVRLIADQLFGIPSVTHTPTSLDTEQLEKTVGVYETDNNQPIEVTQEAGKIFLRGGVNFEMLPVNETTYYAHNDDGVETHFEDEQDGKFNSLTLNIALYRPFKASRKQVVSS